MRTPRVSGVLVTVISLSAIVIIFLFASGGEPVLPREKAGSPYATLSMPKLPGPPPTSDEIYASRLAKPLAEQRREWEDDLKYQRVSDHDGCLQLIELGDRNSVPILIGAYRRSGGSLDDHCLEALQKVAHHNAGNSPNAWERWWQTTRPR